MRPLRLEVEGYTCYRDRQPPLDFSGLSLFAIAGPTGAGKSSILDTMLYALFGKVPRIGKQDVSEFISHGRDSMSVALDFRVRGNDYRVARRSKRSKTGQLKSDATLAEITNGVERSLADQIRPVNDCIVSLLGLGYDEFIQTVVLPQGEFAKFLRATPADQRAILQHLLRHDVFARMRDLAEERRREMDAEMRGLNGQLASYVGATGDALSANEAKLTDAQAQQSEASAAKDAAETDVQEARRRRALTQEIELLRSQWNVLELELPSVEHARLELEDARRAVVIKPRLEAFQQATTRLATATETHLKTGTAEAQASKVRREAMEHSEAARHAALECEDLSLRVRRLDEIAGDVDRREDLTTRLQVFPTQVAEADSVLRTAQRAATAERQKVQSEESNLLSLGAEHESIAFNETLLTSLEAAMEHVFRARALQEEVNDLAADVKLTAQARERTERVTGEADSTHKRAQSHAESCVLALQHVNAALEDGRTRNRAAALREHLHTGHPCPVCLQAVAVMPAAEELPELARLEKESRETEKRAAKAGAASQAAAEALATASARRDEAVRAADLAASKAAARVSDLTTLFETLSDIVPPGQTVGGGPAILVWIEEHRGELRSAKVEKERRQAKIQQIEAKLANARLALAGAEAAATRASDRREQVLRDQLELENELSAAVARIQAVSPHADPRAERNELAGQVAALRTAERTTAEALTRATVAATRAAEQLTAAETSLAEAVAHESITQSALTEALMEAGFSNPDAAVNGQRSAAQQRTLETKIDGFTEKRAGVVQRLADLEPQIAGNEISPELLQEAERRSRDAAEMHRVADQAVTRLEGENTRLREAVKERARLSALRDTLQQSFDVTAEMATDLKGDRFQEYLLEEAFKTLVASASVRMKTISNRYTLEWDAGEFYVVDHDNAGERRLAETLSGGETFMASLCLALQLSDEVLRASGAIQMDSLFIDEGFGTLDPDSLSEVTDAMEALGQEGDRMIGVISHRPELTDRLPGCIRVIKGAGESSWVVERVG